MLLQKRKNGLSMRTAVLIAVLVGMVAMSAPAVAEDLAKDLNSTIQKAKSRMMGMQIDQAVELYQEATTLLDKLKSAQPDHADLDKLQKAYDKLVVDLAKSVTKRASRDISPMRSALSTALRSGNDMLIKAAVNKLSSAIEKHQSNIELAGGEAGAALIADAEADLEKAGKAPSPRKSDNGKSKTPTKSSSTSSSGGNPEEAKRLYSEIQRKFRGFGGNPTAELIEEAKEITKMIEQFRAVDKDSSRADKFNKKLADIIADSKADDVKKARQDIDGIVGTIEMYLERNYEAERDNLKGKRKELGESLDKYRASLELAGDEGMKLIASTEEVMKKVDKQIGAALAGDDLSNEWIAKLDVYRVGKEKDITVSLNSPAQYTLIKKLRKEAGELLKKYEKVDFASGKTPGLESSEEFFRKALSSADKHLEYAISSRVQKAGEKVKYIADWFAADTAWKKDKNKQPKPFAEELLGDACSAVDELADCEPDHPEVARLRDEYKKLVEENGLRQKARVAKTLLRADKYAGSDAKSLKKTAQEIVQKQYPDAKVLRLTIFTEEWSEESVVEWTDTTHSAVRARTTQTLKFCAAIKDKDGVFRDFGYLNQDKKSDGSWGKTYGHMAKYHAPMLESNVDKDAPGK